MSVKVTPKKGAAKKLTAKITVKIPSVAFTDSVSEVKIGATAKVAATSTPATSIKYYSADKTIATVGLTSGTVTGKAEGTVSKLALDASSVLKASMTNRTSNQASVKVNVLDQNGKNFNTDSASNVLTFTLTSGAGVLEEATTVGSPATGTYTAGAPATITAAKAGTATFKVTSNKAGLNYVMVSITVYAVDNTVVKYGLTGIKDLNIEAKYDSELAKTESYKTTVDVKALNKDGFVVEAEEVSGAAITVTKPDKTTANLTSGAENFDASTTFNTVGAYSIVATKNGTTIATATINVKDTGVKPAVTIKKNSVSISDVRTDFTTNFTTETGWTIDGIKFISGNNDAISTSNSGTGTTTLSKSGTGNVTLYNVVVVVSKGGRTFDVATNQSITITD